MRSTIADTQEDKGFPPELATVELIGPLAETLPVALVISDAEGKILAVNAMTEQMFGYRRREMLGGNISMLMPDSERDQHAEYVSTYMRTRKPRIIGIGRYLMARGKDGRHFPIDLSLGEAELSGEAVFIALMAGMETDETDRRKLEELREEIAQAFRMGAMGLLASAIAHEVNQPLTALRNYVETVAHMAESGAPIDREKLHEAMKACSEEAERAGQIIFRLRQFLTRGDAEMDRCSLSRLVSNALALAQADGDARLVNTVVKLSPEADAVLVDGVQIEQVLFNLLRNAFQAMKHEGEAVIRVISKPDRAMTEVAIEDSGPGMDGEKQQLLFRPFNSAKPEGMGVGLSICRAIVEAHGGKLWIETSSLGGAGFHFTVPRVIQAEPDGINDGR
ncbi:sensor histidine kinase [Alteraurantiacibacter aquimixticola]|nr:ATP-binding protein [Alteraurantiacibacter aquimixticola]